jgi:hypothetical protein
MSKTPCPCVWPRHRRFVHEERSGDLCCGQAADDSQGQRDLRLPGEGRVAADEDQPQALVWLGLDGPLQLRQLSEIIVFAP